ncbi:uncharacterized protein LOC144663126 [Oculina patagonica]
MADRAPDVFDTEPEGGTDEENVEEEEPEEEEEGEENSSSFEEEGEVGDDDTDYDPWDPLRRNMGADLRESFMADVKRFLDKGKTKDYAETAAFNTLLPLSRRRLRRIYLERLKWTHRIKRDALHREVMKTLLRFINEDDMDFDEAAESAVEKHKFLLSRVMTKKLLPDEPDDDDEEEDEREEEVEAAV